jgi:ankyrin repeat protein
MFGADPMYSDMEGATALHAAALYASLDIAWLLLDYGSDMNVRDAYGFTPLMMAIPPGREDMVDYLLENNASCTDQDQGWDDPTCHCYSIRSIFDC